jgi:uncharacterized protein YcbK (DUF882 family)
MEQLTKNISRRELKCKCGKCQCQVMDYLTIKLVQDACTHYEKVLNVEKVVLLINSAHRCLAHNRKVGSSDASQHVKSTAMDIRIKGVSPKDLYEYFCATYPSQYGFGLYGSFTHIDSRAGCARW